MNNLCHNFNSVLWVYDLRYTDLLSYYKTHLTRLGLNPNLRLKRLNESDAP